MRRRRRTASNLRDLTMRKIRSRLIIIGILVVMSVLFVLHRLSGKHKVRQTSAGDEVTQ